MERRFACTVCGKCCYGNVPLTIADAIANAGRFPLAMQWTTVRQGAKAYAVTARLGTTVRLANRKTIAVQITPISYVPPAVACPALSRDGLCGIHDHKPARCRAMPFSPFREEADQGDLLVPRPGWLCDTSAAAPVVYRDKVIVERADFDRERQDLAEQVPIIRAYADRLLASAPNVAAALASAAGKPRGGHVVLAFSALVARLPHVDTAEFARQQFPVLTEFAARTADNPDLTDFHRYYRDTAAGMERFLQRH